MDGKTFNVYLLQNLNSDWNLLRNNIVPVVKSMTKYAVMIKNKTDIKILDKAYFLATEQAGLVGLIFLSIFNQLI